MKKHHLIKIITGALLLTSAMTACRDDFDFEEFDNLDDSITVNGKVAFPVINSKMKFSDFKAESINKRLHFDTGSDGLIHMIVNQDDKTIKLPARLSPEEMAALGLKFKPWEKVYETDRQDIYREKGDGNIKIKNPKMTLTKRTRFGSKLDLQINEIRFYKENGTLLKTIYPENPEFAEVCEISNENTNCGLTEALDLMPDYYELKYTAKAENLEKNEQMKVNVVLDLPLEMKAKDFIINDTIKFDMDDIIKELDELLVKCKADNNMPIEVAIQAYFLKGKTVVDSMFISGPWKVEAAKVDGNGNVTQSSISPYENKLGKQRLTKIEKADCDKLAYDIIISTTGDDFVKINDKQTLDLRVSMCAEAGYSTND